MYEVIKMSLLDFDSDLKDLENKKIEKTFDLLRENGYSEYAIEREKEKMFEKPDKLESFDAVDTDSMREVVFYFSPEDYNKFKEFFKVLEYVENNSNQNWLLLGLLKLISEGKIGYSDKLKDVWVV